MVEPSKHLYGLHHFLLLVIHHANGFLGKEQEVGVELELGHDLGGHYLGKLVVI